MRPSAWHRNGVPYFKIRDLIKQYDVVVRSSNFALYGDMSHRVMSILSSFAPDAKYIALMNAPSILRAYSPLFRIMKPMRVKSAKSFTSKQAFRFLSGLGVAKRGQNRQSHCEKTQMTAPAIFFPHAEKQALQMTEIDDVWDWSALG